MKTSVIEVHGMLSVLSVNEVEKRIGEVPGVESVTVNYAAGNATVRFDETRIELADIKSSVRQRGYEPASAGESPAGESHEGHEPAGSAPASAPPDAQKTPPAELSGAGAATSGKAPPESSPPKPAAPPAGDEQQAGAAPKQS